MKLIAILTTLVLGFASTNAQHHLPPSATSNANINDGGINSPTSSNIDIDSVATIIDKANDNTERKLHDMLTSVKDVIEEKYGLDLNDALGLGGNGRRLSKSHKSEGIDIIDKVFLLIVLLLVEFLGYTYVDYLSGLVYLVVDMIRLTGEEEEDIADEITAANHGHDGSSSNTAKSEGTDSSAKASKESKSSKSGGGSTCPLGAIIPGSVTNGNPCCTGADCLFSFCLANAGTRYCRSLSTSTPGVIDCSTPCTDSTDCNDGALPFCGTVSIEQCTDQTAPATGICVFD